ncbi:MAG: CBS domain-containing protein [Desulfobacteraceae bacterium]|nr:CBS domain-containing protein [Desulfobacteraceae bacterium]
MSFEKNVQDFMHPVGGYGHITSDRPVRQALVEIQRRLDRNQRPCLIVIEENEAGEEVIVGTVTQRELVFGIAGHFLRGAERIGAIFWEGQLATESRQSIQQSIREIMSPIQVCIRADEMLMEAIFLLNQYRLDMLPVLQGDEVLGFIHLEDIISEVSRIAS